MTNENTNRLMPKEEENKAFEALASFLLNQYKKTKRMNQVNTKKLIDQSHEMYLNTIITLEDRKNE